MQFATSSTDAADTRKAWVTIKGKKDATGAGSEYEYEVPYEEAEEMALLSIGSVISKTRYEVILAGHEVSVDVFHGDNEGLVIAEVEHRPMDFVSPLGWEEITAQPEKWSNLALSLHPIKR